MSNLLIIILLLVLVDIRVSQNDEVFIDTAEIKSKISKKLKKWLKS